jgi:hypothetical protein
MRVACEPSTRKDIALEIPVGAQYATTGIELLLNNGIFEVLLTIPIRSRFPDVVIAEVIIPKVTATRDLSLRPNRSTPTPYRATDEAS